MQELHIVSSELRTIKVEVRKVVQKSHTSIAWMHQKTEENELKTSASHDMG